MSKRELPSETLYDVRLIERHIKEGLITEEDVTKHISAVDDASENADVIDMDVLLGGDQDSDNAPG
ncbi:MAG: hypothetical protein VX834_12750 [Myxococcota bacterium]|nr:hypothetical protein [Myxococcota bacterium]